MSFIDKFDLSENGVRIGIILFNTYPSVIHKLSDDKEALKRDAISIRTMAADGSTYLQRALIASFEEFAKNGRKGYNKIIIVVTDGAADDEIGTRIVVKQLQQVKVQICGVLIDSSSSHPNFLKEICGDCYGQSNYETLAKELEKLDICL